MSADINFSEVSGREGNLGLITLTRPQALNALNKTMLREMDQQLTQWQAANHIKAVVIRAAEGRAFCAGGDIRAVYQEKMADDPTVLDFFRDEYQLNRRIFNYPKPYIALLDGIVMGGGAGISLHGSHRVATNQLVFAMPETGIGFYPDVGATYFLSRLPFKIGIYLGLTGARINAADCLAIGLVNEIVDKSAFPNIIYQLADTILKNNPNDLVTEILQKFSEPAADSELFAHREEIANCFAEPSIEKIIHALENFSSAWCLQVATLLKTKSPTSLKVTLRALQEAEQKSFAECMDTELILTTRFLQGHDFFEGIRAAVIDKDQSPQWQPAEINAVKSESIEKYFLALDKVQKVNE